MNTLSAWLLSIIGIVIIGVIIDLVMPEGSISKYIKSVFSFIVILIIISPLTKVDNFNLTLDNFISNNKIAVDEEYVFSINQKLLDQIRYKIISDSEKSGIHNIDVNFLSEIDDYRLKINEVNIFIGNMVIDKESEHINKYQILVNIVNTYIKIDKENIKFYEWKK